MLLTEVVTYASATSDEKNTPQGYYKTLSNFKMLLTKVVAYASVIKNNCLGFAPSVPRQGDLYELEGQAFEFFSRSETSRDMKKS